MLVRANSLLLLLIVLYLIRIMKNIETPIATISFNKGESILHIIVKENAEMNVENTQIHYKKINKLVGNQQYLALVDSTNFYSVDKEAWKYASLEEIASNRKAVAHYNSCDANILTTTFFKNNYHTLMPVKIFDSKESALEWLKSFN